jgi:ABC-type multidrug transport system permease subunit
MLYQILAIAKKELKVIAHDRGALVGLFLLPIAFILVMTTALQGVFDSGSSDNPVQLLIVNQDQGTIATNVIHDLGTIPGLEMIERQAGQPLTRAAAEDLITTGKYSIALVFPSDFSARILAMATQADSPKTTVTFITDPTVGSQLLSPAQGMVQGYVDREASIAQVPGRTQLDFEALAGQAPAGQAQVVRTIGATFASQLATDQSQRTNDTGVVYEVVSPAKYQTVVRPTSAQQNVPGYTIYGVFFIMQTIAISILREKSEGTFRRLQAAPLAQATLLAGKLLPYFLVNLIQIALMFTVGVLVFHMSLGHDPLALLLLSLAAAATATGLGILLASLTKTQEQAGSLGTLLAVMLSAIGGSMIPTSVMPNFMQTLARFTPHFWGLAGFQDVMVRGLGVSAILPSVGMLLAFAAAFWAIAIWRFRFE